MTLEELKLMWAEDCVIDSDDLGGSAAITPNLHSKYINETIATKLRITKIQLEIAQLRAVKGRYFRGEMTTDELKERGWEQCHLRTLKSDIVDLVDADNDVQVLITREQYLKTMIYFLESVLGEIKARSFHVKAAIDWARFRAGN